MTKAAKYVNRTTTRWLLSLRPNRRCRWSNNCNRMWQNHDIPTLSLRMKRPTQVKVRPNRFRGVNTKKVTVLMTQFSVNLNDALKGHKLQGMSKVKRPSHHTRRVFKQHTAKDVWNLGKYTFFRVCEARNRSAGLYIFKNIDMKESFKLSEEFTQFFRQTQCRMKNFIQVQRRTTLVNHLNHCE